MRKSAAVFVLISVILFGDVFDDILIPGSFDLIVLNSSIQYFPDIKILMDKS